MPDDDAAAGAAGQDAQDVQDAQDAQDVQDAGAARAAQDAEVAAWVAAGSYARAANALWRRGTPEALGAAQALFERLWDYQNAADVARQRGEPLELLRLSLLGQDLATAGMLIAQVPNWSRDEQLRAAEILIAQRRWGDAAAVRERLGDREGALALFAQAERPLDVGRLAEQAGDARRALQAYEQFLALEEDVSMPSDAGGETGPALDHVLARRGLARALQRLERHDEAVPILQAARRMARGRADAADLLDGIEAALAASLHALGAAAVVRPILVAYHARHRDQPMPLGAADLHMLDVLARRTAQRSPAHAETEEPPRLLGRYRLLRLLGAGGHGRVYLAEDEAGGPQVAVKLLPGAPRDDAPGPSARRMAELHRRFTREAQVLRGLHHPNLVAVHAFHEGAGVLVMEYLPGGSLAQHIGERAVPLPPSRVRAVLLDALAGLEAAHAAGVLHRDLKPANFFLTSIGTVKLGDFGAAHLQELGATQTESLVGTLAYMAPEQLTGAPLSFATDLYALGVTAFQLLTGHLPFPGPDFASQHLHAPPPPVRTLWPELSPPWEALCAQLMAKPPAQRGDSLGAVRQAVRALPVEALDPALRLRDELPHAPGAASPDTPPAAAHQSGTALETTPYSTLFLRSEPRTGRPVVTEHFAPGVLQSEAGAAHLRWLRALARLGGPGLQRVLRIDLIDLELELEAAGSAGGAVVYYEAPLGPPVSPQTPIQDDDLRLLREVLALLHDAGVVHGAVERSVLCEPTGAMIQVHGRGPLGRSAGAPVTAEHDLAGLRALARDAR